MVESAVLEVDLSYWGDVKRNHPPFERWNCFLPPPNVSSVIWGHCRPLEILSNWISAWGVVVVPSTCPQWPPTRHFSAVHH